MLSVWEFQTKQPSQVRLNNYANPGSTEEKVKPQAHQPHMLGQGTTRGPPDDLATIFSVSRTDLFSPPQSCLLSTAVPVMLLALLLLCGLRTRTFASLVLGIPRILTSPTNPSPVVWLFNSSNPTPSTLENLVQSFSALMPVSYDSDKESFGVPTIDSCLDAYK